MRRNGPLLMKSLLGWLAMVQTIGCSGGAAPGNAGNGGRNLAPVEGLTLPFPRLMMWWPDTTSQPLRDIARYDLVMLDSTDAGVLHALRDFNSDILLLVAANACEMDSTPLNEYDEPLLLEWTRRIPPEWLLTQVGTTLTADVDDTATVFEVERLTVTDGDAVYDLFIPDDQVLIDGEVVRIESVDATSSRLTVERGFRRAAATHAAGTRIAALISFWPGSWMLNVSTQCPAVTVDPDIGPERWTDYNARFARQLMSTGDWDGIILDRSDPNESWLIGESTARTIDPDRSNRLLADYREFDALWNEGLLQYESAIREALGPDAIILCNLGINNYEDLNGCIFEGFPGDIDQDLDSDFTAYWHRMTFGPSPRENSGSYGEWMSQAYEPRIALIETYDDDGSPEPTGGGYENPCDDPDFVPDYRKMRFGLTTALLNDGMFSYEMNTEGHGYLCLMWFDEYDNAGAGQGYLGMPLGPAVQAVPSLTTPNLLGDSTFESSMGSWGIETLDGYAASTSLDDQTAAEGDQSVRVDVTQSAGDFGVAITVIPLADAIEADVAYAVSFQAKAETPQQLLLWAQEEQDPWPNVIDFGPLAITTDWQRFELPATAVAAAAPAGFYIALGQETGAVWFDDIEFRTGGSRQVWRRDFDHGIALVNATAQPTTIRLERPYRKIAGTQDATVNDGSTVSEVTVPPWDGIILLRTADPGASAAAAFARGIAEPDNPAAAPRGWPRI